MILIKMKLNEIIENEKFPNFITTKNVNSLNKKLKKKKKDVYGIPLVVPFGTSENDTGSLDGGFSGGGE